MKQRGDTIIEVLLAMSIIGMVLGASFGIANRSLAIGRTAQERTEALKLAESQLEMMKQVIDEDDNPGEKFCMGTRELGVGEFEYYVVGNAAGTGADNMCRDVDGGLYSVIIESPNASNPAYTINVTWQRINTRSSELGQVTLHYKLGAL